MKKISMTKGGANKTFKYGFKEFITTCKVKNLADQTLEYYEDYARKFGDYLEQQGILLIQDINLSVVHEFILYMKALGTQKDIILLRHLKKLLIY